MDHHQQAELAARLYERRGEAGDVKRAECTIGDWKPQPASCHANVDLWLRHNPQHRSVRGWWYCDYALVGTAEFFAHSVIANENGELFDITPTTPEEALAKLIGYIPERRFIRHDGTEDSFKAIR